VVKYTASSASTATDRDPPDVSLPKRERFRFATSRRVPPNALPLLVAMDQVEVAVARDRDVTDARCAGDLEIFGIHDGNACRCGDAQPCPGRRAECGDDQCREGLHHLSTA